MHHSIASATVERSGRQRGSVIELLDSQWLMGKIHGAYKLTSAVSRWQILPD